MELTQGYKPTEVGTIPVDWDVSSFNEQFRISAGGDVNRRLSADERDDSHPYPIYSNALTNEGLYGYCTHANHPAGSITITARGRIGFATYRSHKFTAIGRVLVLEPRNEISGQFFAEFINDRVWIADESTGVPQLTAPQLGRHVLAIPPYDEQCAIVTVLSDVDALLDGLDRLIAKKRDLKQAAMQQLLTGRTRLPGFQDEWGLKQVKEFTSCTSGGTPSTQMPAYWGGSIRWMSSGELHLKYVHDVDGRITEHGLINSSTQILPTSCVLVGLAGQGKTRGTVAMNLVPLCTNQSIAAILPNPTFVPEYLYHCLDNRYEELRELSSGDGGRGGLNLMIIGSLIIPFPSFSEQRKIAFILSDMDAEITALEAHRDKTRNLKQAMMQELLTGRTRLVKPEVAHA